MSLTDHIFKALAQSDPSDRDVGKEEPRNFLIQIASLVASKTADGLLDAKLILSWLASALGAPGTVIGLLVPIREAGALLPQLPLAPWITRIAERKYVWSVGALLQGVCALGMGASTLFLDGPMAWAGLLCFLALLSLARALCSLSHKDALAQTISKTRRGTVTGTASSLSAACVILFAVALSFGLVPLTAVAISVAVLSAGGLFIAASLVFVSLRTADRSSERDGKDGHPGYLTALRSDAHLRRLIVARSFLTATALAPPFIIAASGGTGGQSLGNLGPLVLASSAAAIVSGYVWGRLSDRSSRKTLMFSGALAAVVLGIFVALMQTQSGMSEAIVAAAVFAIQIAYEGTRTGRKTHLTDMSDDDERAGYTAISNTLVGLVLVAGGTFGILADLYGVAAVLGCFAVMCLAGVVAASGLDEEQEEAAS